jgi:tight adherence protein B
MNSFFWMYGIALCAAVSAGVLVFLFFRLKISDSKLSFQSTPFIKGPNFNLRLPFLIPGAVGFLSICFGWFWFSAFLIFGLAWMGWRYFPSFKSKWRLKKKIEKMNDLFPQTLGMAVQALKAGQTIPQVLEYLSKESPAPLREEWKQVCNQIDLGSSAEQALAQMGERYPSFSDFNQFLQSYKISRRTGANLTHLLEVLLEGTETRNRLFRKMDSMTAQARLSGLLMGLLPFLLAFVFFTMDPTILKPLVEQKAGWGILVLSFLMELMGFLWIRQLLRIEV